MTDIRQQAINIILDIDVLKKQYENQEFDETYYKSHLKGYLVELNSANKELIRMQYQPIFHNKVNYDNKGSIVTDPSWGDTSKISGTSQYRIHTESNAEYSAFLLRSQERLQIITEISIKQKQLTQNISEEEKQQLNEEIAILQQELDNSYSQEENKIYKVSSNMTNEKIDTINMSITKSINDIKTLETQLSSTKKNTNDYKNIENQIILLYKRIDLLNNRKISLQGVLKSSSNTQIDLSKQTKIQLYKSRDLKFSELKNAKLQMDQAKLNLDTFYLNVGNKRNDTLIETENNLKKQYTISKENYKKTQDEMAVIDARLRSIGGTPINKISLDNYDTILKNVSKMENYEPGDEIAIAHFRNDILDRMNTAKTTDEIYSAMMDLRQLSKNIGDSIPLTKINVDTFDPLYDPNELYEEFSLLLQKEIELQEIYNEQLENDDPEANTTLNVLKEITKEKEIYKKKIYGYGNDRGLAKTSFFGIQTIANSNGTSPQPSPQITVNTTNQESREVIQHLTQGLTSSGTYYDRQSRQYVTLMDDSAALNRNRYAGPVRHFYTTEQYNNENNKITSYYNNRIGQYTEEYERGVREIQEQYTEQLVDINERIDVVNLRVQELSNSPYATEDDIEDANLELQYLQANETAIMDVMNSSIESYSANNSNYQNIRRLEESRDAALQQNTETYNMARLRPSIEEAQNAVNIYTATRREATDAENDLALANNNYMSTFSSTVAQNPEKQAIIEESLSSLSPDLFSSDERRTAYQNAIDQTREYGAIYDGFGTIVARNPDDMNEQTNLMIQTINDEMTSLPNTPENMPIRMQLLEERNRIESIQTQINPPELVASRDVRNGYVERNDEAQENLQSATENINNLRNNTDGGEEVLKSVEGGDQIITEIDENKSSTTETNATNKTLTGFESINNGKPFYLQFPTEKAITEFRLKNGFNPFDVGENANNNNQAKERRKDQIARDSVHFTIFNGIPGGGKIEEIPGRVGVYRERTEDAERETLGVFTIYPSDMDWLQFSHDHEYDETSQAVQTINNAFGTIQTIAEVGTLIRNVRSAENPSAGLVRSHMRRLDSLDQYTGSKKLNLSIPFILFTKGDFLNDIFRPISFLTALSYPKRQATGSEIDAIQNLIKDYVNNNTQQNLEKFQEMEKQASSTLGAVEKFRMSIFSRPEYMSVRHASGLFTFPLAVITNFSYQFHGPWINSKGEIVSVTDEEKNIFILNAASGIKSGVLKHEKLDYAFPSYAKCTITIRNSVPLFRDDFMMQFLAAGEGADALVSLSERNAAFDKNSVPIDEITKPPNGNFDEAQQLSEQATEDENETYYTNTTTALNDQINSKQQDVATIQNDINAIDTELADPNITAERQKELTELRELRNVELQVTNNQIATLTQQNLLLTDAQNLRNSPTPSEIRMETNASQLELVNNRINEIENQRRSVSSDVNPAEYRRIQLETQAELIALRQQAYHLNVEQTQLAARTEIERNQAIVQETALIREVRDLERRNSENDQQALRYVRQNSTNPNVVREASATLNSVQSSHHQQMQDYGNRLTILIGSVNTLERQRADALQNGDPQTAASLKVQIDATRNDINDLEQQRLQANTDYYEVNNE